MSNKSLQINLSFFDAAYALPQDVARKVWKTLQMRSRDTRHPGLHFEKLKGSVANLHSLRVDDKYRIILQQTGVIPTFMYVGPHDKAYGYAERTTVPIPGAMVAEVPGRYNPIPAEEVYDLPEKSIELLLGTVKYLPLAKFLITRPKSQRTVELKFKEIEQIIGASLPPSARKHAAWWANEEGETTHVQAHAWIAVGWRVHADRTISRATFERTKAY